MSSLQRNIKKTVALLPVLLFLSLRLSAAGPATESDSTVNDGPYFYLSNDTLRVIWIENSKLLQGYLLPGRNTGPPLPAGFPDNYRELIKPFTAKPDFRQRYRGVDNIAVISDVHGNYAAYLNHLSANGIIDERLNWKFGKGHLVFLGDAFDRGDQVTEILWHLFKLERQAARAGGRVHYILGNHELMVLAGDLRYIHEKYNTVETITGISHTGFYPENSVLGKWLRAKPAMITINNILFVHGGASPVLVQKGLKIKTVNQIFHERITGKSTYLQDEDEILKLLEGNEGPSWYRGYFTDSTLTAVRIDSILNFYGTDHIVVGHTTHRNMRILFEKRIFGIDTGIGYDLPGNMLIYKKGRFYRSDLSGRRTEL